MRSVPRAPPQPLVHGKCFFEVTDGVAGTPQVQCQQPELVIDGATEARHDRGDARRAAGGQQHVIAADGELEVTKPRRGLGEIDEVVQKDLVAGDLVEGDSRGGLERVARIVGSTGVEQHHGPLDNTEQAHPCGIGREVPVEERPAAALEA